MPATKFELVDLSTWKTQDGKNFEASPEKRDAILETSCALLSEKARVLINPRRFKAGKHPDTNMLVVLANRSLISVSGYSATKYKPSDKQTYVRFHFASVPGAIKAFSKKMKNPPSRILFDWMRKRVEGPIVLRSNIGPQNRRFITRLKREGILSAHAPRPGRASDFTISREPLAVTNAKKRRR